VSTTLYFWVTFYEGDMTINDQTVDISGTNVFDFLDAGELNFPPLTIYFEARKGRWGYLDTTLIGLEFGASDISLKFLFAFMRDALQADGFNHQTA